LNMLLGMKSGVYFQYPLAESLDLKFEFNIRSERAEEKFKNLEFGEEGLSGGNNELDISFRMDYLEVPAVVKYKFAKNSVTQPELFLGGVLNYYLRGLANWRYWEEDEFLVAKKIQAGAEDLDNYKNITTSFICGLKIHYHNMQFLLGYELGLTRLKEEMNPLDKFGESRLVEEFFLSAWDYHYYTLSLRSEYNFAKNKGTEKKYLYR
jgi:hypothetical protein